MKKSRITIVILVCILFISGLACETESTISLPSAPTLSSPHNGATVNGTSITFRWQGSSYTAGYFLRVSESTYPNLDDETSFISNEVGKVFQYTVSGFPDDGTEYIWGVWSGNDAGWCPKPDVLANARIFTNGQAQ